MENQNYLSWSTRELKQKRKDMLSTTLLPDAKHEGFRWAFELILGELNRRQAVKQTRVIIALTIVTIFATLLPYIIKPI
jgi:hypothetical protein